MAANAAWAAAQPVQDLAAEGAGVVGVERQTKNLEEIFLSLTNTQTGKEVG